MLGWLGDSADRSGVGPGPADTDAWVWQREIADLGEYAALWLRDAGDGPERPGYGARYDAWVDGLRQLGAVAIGMGQIHLQRTGRRDPVRVADDVPGVLVPPLGDTVSGWFARANWLATTDDPALLRARLRVAAGVERVDITDLGAPDLGAPDLGAPDLGAPDVGAFDLGAADPAAAAGVEPPPDRAAGTRSTALRQRDGLRWSVDADDAMATLVAACDGSRPLGLLVDLVTLSRPELAVADAGNRAMTSRALLAVRDLVARGLLEPA